MSLSFENLLFQTPFTSLLNSYEMIFKLNASFWGKLNKLFDQMCLWTANDILVFIDADVKTLGQRVDEDL